MLAPLRGALLAGSAGRGDADEWSDIDLLVYVDELPPEGTLELIREAVDGVETRSRAARTPDFDGLDFAVAGVLVQVLFARVSAIEDRLRRRLIELEELEEPWQKGALGLLEGLVLHDDGTIARWRERLRDFPEPLRRALIELHWRDLFPLWHYEEQIAARDAELWRLEMLIDGALRLLGVLAALNRIYYSRFQVKRLRRLTASFALAPRHLADRLDSLPQLPPPAAAEELGQLVLETRELVLQELPDLELPLDLRPGTRQEPIPPLSSREPRSPRQRRLRRVPAVVNEKIPLSGGATAERVVRIGATVRKPPRRRSQLMRDVLLHLDRAGFGAAPQWLGVDEQGRDVLSWIEGETFTDRSRMHPYIGDPPDRVTFSDEQLAAVMRLLRRYHDTFAGEVICHGDFGPWNIVWRDGMPLAVIDFDDVHPGEPAEDVAYALRMFVGYGFAAGEPAELVRRTGVALGAYGAGFDVPAILERGYEFAEGRCRRYGWHRQLAKLPTERAWLAANQALFGTVPPPMHRF